MEISKRYIRLKIKDGLVLNIVGKHGETPIIDLSRLDCLQDSDDEILTLSLACEDWGFVQVMLVIEESFQLPLEERKAYEQLPGSAEGYGQTFVISEEQILDRGDMYFLSNNIWKDHETLAYRSTQVQVNFFKSLLPED
ncbi:putative (S)-norcoclaurine synthase [Dioscorea sansibarensis]